MGFWIFPLAVKIPSKEQWWFDVFFTIIILSVCVSLCENPSIDFCADKIDTINWNWRFFHSFVEIWAFEIYEAKDGYFLKNGFCWV